MQPRAAPALFAQLMGNASPAALLPQWYRGPKTTYRQSIHILVKYPLSIYKIFCISFDSCIPADLTIYFLWCRSIVVANTWLFFKTLHGTFNIRTDNMAGYNIFKCQWLPCFFLIELKKFRNINYFLHGFYMRSH